jgi:hypothetical protein
LIHIYIKIGEGNVLDGVLWAGFIWLRIGTSGGAFMNTVMNLSGSIKCWEILE